MKINVCTTYEEMSRRAADIITSQVTLKPDSVLGLATGSTPLGMYAELVKRYNGRLISFRDVKTVNLDEYCGLTPDNDQSYSYFMHKNLFDKIDIREENVHLPDGTNPDAEAETARYDRLIESLGGIDVQLLGIGVDGHIGFNEPDDSFSTGTVKIKLTESTIEANSRFFASEADVPRYAYSMGCRSSTQRRYCLSQTAQTRRRSLKRHSSERSLRRSPHRSFSLCPTRSMSILTRRRRRRSYQSIPMPLQRCELS